MNNEMNNRPITVVIGEVNNKTIGEHKHYNIICSDEMSPLCFSEDPVEDYECSVCLNTIEQNPYAITDIPEKLGTDEFKLVACIRALRKDPQVVNVIPHWSNQYCLSILREMPELMGVMKRERLPYDILKMVLEENPKAVKNVLSNRLTSELAEVVLKQDGMLIRFFPDWVLDERLILIAVKNNPKAFEYVYGGMMTKRLCRQYILSNQSSFVMIPNELQNYMKKISKRSKGLKRLKEKGKKM
jgi:hypothetical protein